MNPPQAKRIPHTTSRHGIEHVDDWFWLRDRDDPDTVAYLEAENTFCDSWFEPHSVLVNTVFEEIKGRIQETDLSVPSRKGPWSYYTRTIEGESYPRHCRRPIDADGAEGHEQELLDENIEAHGREYFAVGAFDVSVSHQRLAWSFDVDGGERYTMRVRDLASGIDLPDTIDGTYYGTAWSRDDAYLFYVTPDDAMRPWKVWRHEIGTESVADACIFTEPDERFFVEVGNTRSSYYIVIGSSSKTTSEVWILAADDPTAPLQVVEPRRDGHEYSLDHQGDRFLILSNAGADDFRIMAAPVTSPNEAHWRELVASQPGRRISDVSAFATFFVVSAMDRGLETLTVHRSDDAETLAFDEDIYSAGLSGNPEYITDMIRFDYQSMVTPASVFDHNVVTGHRVLRKQQPVLGDFDPSKYRMQREWASSPDGTRVPLDLVMHVDTALDGTAPVLLYGYGSYEISVPPYFSVARLSLLDRGVVFALAHPRGGGEMGRQWYLNGKLLNKQNTFADMLACADHVASLCDGSRIVIRGGSAGGLLVGACATQRPERFVAVIAEVPFVDVVTTMLDSSLPLTVTEWEEWGNPAEEPYGSYISSYAPYEHTDSRTLPSLYVTAGLNDPRVSFHEPAKWVAKVRALSASTKVLLRTEMGAGHGGPSGRYAAWKDEAHTLAFALLAMGKA